MYRMLMVAVFALTLVFSIAALTGCPKADGPGTDVTPPPVDMPQPPEAEGVMDEGTPEDTEEAVDEEATDEEVEEEEVETEDVSPEEPVEAEATE